MKIKPQLIEIAKKVTAKDTTALKYAEHLFELISAIDPQKICSDYVKAINESNYALACDILAEYYRKKPRNIPAELSAKGSYNNIAADRTVEGYACEVNVDWKFDDGVFDFLFNPTYMQGSVNHEWLWQFNRHSYWINLARAYVGTSDEKYALAFERQLLGWIDQTDIPEKWNAPGSAWRTIECGLRLLGSWQVAFDGFIRSREINNVTMLLMIASMLRQANHLVSHPTKRNWLMMEMNGVYTFSVLFDELKCSEANRKIATEYLLRELSSQILPDGMHNELSPDYQRVVFGCAANFYSVALAIGKKDEIPSEFTDLIKSTAGAAIALSTPSFAQPLTNDCHVIPTASFTKRAEMLFGERPEWTFVNSCRAQGHAPSGETASVFLNYAGFAVMRNDWSEDSAYLCFDVGPLGMAHAHQDKLNIIMYKGEEELVFDDGGGHYDLSEVRQYAKSGYAHNTVLVDGNAQNRKLPLQYEEPVDAHWISNRIFDYAFGIYDDAFGQELLTPVTHKREVRFCKPDFFCVSDTLISRDGNTHDYEILFHLNTITVNILDEYDNAVMSDFGKKYDIVIIPVDTDESEVSLKVISGQTDPEIRGWYNGRNETYLHKATTVSREIRGVRDHRFTTLLFPVKRGGELPKIEKTTDGRIKVCFNQKEYDINVNELFK